MVIKATATNMPPQPGITAIKAANNITKYVEDVIHASNVSAPTSTSIES